MKEVLLVRHAKSSWAFPNLKDEERPLNVRGLRDAPLMASFCKMKKMNLSHLFSSTALRAFTTADFFQKEFKVKLSKETDLYFGDEEDWLHLINNLGEEVKFPAFFSHNPTITYFSNLFNGEDIENVPTCGVIHLESTVENWSAFHYDNTIIKNVYFPKTI
jgi:phosphohistidine phosphatase